MQAKLIHNALFVVFAMLCVALLAGRAATAQDDGSASPGYLVGVVPQYEARELASIWQPLLRMVSEKAGVSLTLQGARNIPAFEQALNQGEYDFAYMNPYHSLVAHQAQGYAPLLRDASRKLSGVLVVRADSDLQTVQDLDRAQISFPAPNALGASLLMRAELTRLHGISFDPVYAQTHASAYLNTVLRQTAAAGGVMSTLRRESAEVQDALRILYQTREMEPHPFSAHPRIPEDLREKVTQAFIQVAATEDGKALVDRIPMFDPQRTSIAPDQGLSTLHLEAFYVR